MLKLMEHAVNNLKLSTSEWKYMEMIGVAPTNLSNIRKGRQGFSKDHIENACRLTGASADYIFGFTPHMLRKEIKDPIEAIKQAVTALEEKRDSKKAGNKFANSKK